MKAGGIVLVIFGLLIIWLSVTGRLPVFLASILAPNGVTPNG